MSTTGAAAALVAGTVTVAAGWSWGILLLLLFVSSSILSRVGEPQKRAMVGDVIEKDGERDAWQVLANGGVFVAAALGWLLAPSPAWQALGAGALAASTADTWATEVGTLIGGEPISIRTGKSVPPGTSGGITLFGTLAALSGALLIALTAAVARWTIPFTAALLGGIAGAFADSILGATIQSRRRCEVCGKSTEKVVHGCGAPTIHCGGVRWIDNDVVNLLSTGVGALVAFLVS